MKSIDAFWIRIKLLGISVTPLTPDEAAYVATHSAGKTLMLNHNLHSAYLFDKDEEFRRLYRQADWIIIDGTPIAWLANASSSVANLSASHRIGSTDWIAALARQAISQRLFVFGATAQSNALAVKNLRSLLPEWTISGQDGYTDHSKVVRQITDFQPDIVLVGLGMPIQEKFLLRHLSQLPDATYATVGGAIDYLAGATSLAPRWLGRFGLEWAWRLAHQPRRLAYRYCVEPVLLFGRLFRHCLTARVVRIFRR